MLVKLMSSRYNNINEYKQRIYAGPLGLPSYVCDVLNEIDFWQCNIPSNRFLMNMLTSGINTTPNVVPVNAMPNVDAPSATSTTLSSEFSASNISRLLQNLEISKSNLKATPATAQNNTTNFEDIIKTLTYLRLLKSNKINCHLDYESLDEKNGNNSSQEVLRFCLILNSPRNE